MLTLIVEGGRPPSGPVGRQVCVWRDNGGGVFARAWVDGDACRLEWQGLGTFRFDLVSTVVRVWPAPGATASVVDDVFGRVLQPIILQARGVQSLHASAVLGAQGALAFCGTGYSGKSTLAFALGRRGFHHIADDAVVIERARAPVTVRLMPFAPGLREPTLRHFDVDRSSAAATPAVGSLVPLRAIFLLEQDAQAPRPERPARIAPVQAFSALVTHARCFDEGDAAHTRRLIDDYLAIVEDVPVFALRYPPHFGQLQDLLDLIEQESRELGVTPFDRPHSLAAIR